MELIYKEMTIEDLDEIIEMYIETFNAPPWNDKWTYETVHLRLSQMINVQDFYGLCVYHQEKLSGIALGSMEQYYDGVRFNFKEFCVRNHLRGYGLGTKLLNELETRLTSMGVYEIMFYTLRHESAQGFYEKRGYSEIKELVIMNKKFNG